MATRDAGDVQGLSGFRFKILNEVTIIFPLQ